MYCHSEPAITLQSYDMCVCGDTTSFLAVSITKYIKQAVNIVDDENFIGIYMGFWLQPTQTTSPFLSRLIKAVQIKNILKYT